VAAGTMTHLAQNVQMADIPPLGYGVQSASGGIIQVAPVIQAAQLAGNSITFTWSTVTNQMYQIQATASLTSANWTNLGGAITASNAITTSSQTIDANSQQFYRVILLP